MTNQHHYKAKLVWTGGEKGPTTDYKTYSREYSIAIDGKQTLRASADPAFKGDPALYNPEEMLVASLSGCHLLSYLALCTKHKIVVTSYEDKAEGIMVQTGPTAQFERVVLHPRVTISAGDIKRAHQLHEEANELCFIARSVNFPVYHEPDITQA